MFQNVLKFLLPFILSFGTINCPRIWQGSSTSGSDPTGGGDTTLPDVSDCDGVPAQLKQILLANGYSETSAAAIMGNIKGESGYRINVIEGGRLVDETWRAYDNGSKTFSGGFGLVQWTSAGRVRNLQNYADSIGKSVVSIEAQGGFLIQELQTYGFTPASMNAMSLGEATWKILRDYETPMSVICWSGHSNPSYQCSGNSAYPRNISHSTLTSNQSVYARAFSSYSARFSYAQSAQSVGTESCGSGSDDSSGDDSGTDSGSPSGEDTTTGSAGTAYGASSGNGYYSQFDSGISGTRWRINNDGSGWSISASGCSLVAVANVMKFLNKTPNNPNTLADYTKTAVCGESCTGWGGSVAILRQHYGLSFTTLWESQGGNLTTKLSKVRQALANGKPIIMSGNRANSIDCSSSTNLRNGNCVFSRGGHFVAIVGVTADDKLVVANPANGGGVTPKWTYPAENVLRYANKAYSVR